MRKLVFTNLRPFLCSVPYASRDVRWRFILPATVTNPCSVVLRVDAFNPAVAGAGGSQVPPQMMGMGMNARGGAMGPDGAGNLGAAMMPENGAMVTYAQNGVALTLKFSLGVFSFLGRFKQQNDTQYLGPNFFQLNNGASFNFGGACITD